MRTASLVIVGMFLVAVSPYAASAQEVDPGWPRQSPEYWGRRAVSTTAARTSF
ncbi:MAG: hypothetical protein R2712_12175 [Vicinamibacterales bacterium]